MTKGVATYEPERCPQWTQEAFDDLKEIYWRVEADIFWDINAFDQWLGEQRRMCKALDAYLDEAPWYKPWANSHGIGTI